MMFRLRKTRVAVISPNNPAIRTDTDTADEEGSFVIFDPAENGSQFEVFERVHGIQPRYPRHKSPGYGKVTKASGSSTNKLLVRSFPVNTELISYISVKPH